MKLFLVRHGQTEANANGLFNGRNEKDLNDVGVKQAEALIPEIEKLPIDLVISSPLKRTIHTANILNLKNLIIQIDDRLIERDFKEMTLKPTNLIKDKSKLYNLGSYEEIEGIEAFQTIYDRIEDFIHDIKIKYADKNILIVTHGDIIVAFQMYFDKKFLDYPKTAELIKYEL